jgi:hypothetical protein
MRAAFLAQSIAVRDRWFGRFAIFRIRSDQTGPSRIPPSNERQEAARGWAPLSNYRPQYRSRPHIDLPTVTQSREIAERIERAPFGLVRVLSGFCTRDRRAIFQSAW